jgi:hypothetical protein
MRSGLGNRSLQKFGTLTKVLEDRIQTRQKEGMYSYGTENTCGLLLYSQK